MANLGNGHKFIGKKYISIGTRPFGKPKVKPRELMLKVDKYHTIVESRDS